MLIHKIFLLSFLQLILLIFSINSSNAQSVDLNLDKNQIQNNLMFHDKIKSYKTLLVFSRSPKTTMFGLPGISSLVKADVGHGGVAIIEYIEGKVTKVTTISKYSQRIEIDHELDKDIVLKVLEQGSVKGVSFQENFLNDWEEKEIYEFVKSSTNEFNYEVFNLNCIDFVENVLKIQLRIVDNESLNFSNPIKLRTHLNNTRFVP
jgi:hypothetical protein